MTQDRKPGDVVQREGALGDVLYFGDADPAMRAAIARARMTLPGFIAELDDRVPGSSYLIKAAFTRGASTEFLWLSDLQYFEGMFFGAVENEGLDVDVHLGDRHIVELDEVIDWIVATEKTYRGGFTNRVVRDRASPEERARIDARWNLLPE